MNTHRRATETERRTQPSPCAPPGRVIDQATVLAFERLVWSVARRSGLCQTDAEDAVQQTWLRLLENQGSLRDPACLPGWLTTTAARESRAVVRRRTRELVTDALPERPSEDQEPVVAVMRQENARALRRAVITLPDRERTLVTCLLEEEPMTYDEISARINMPRGSIGPIRARALRRLALSLAADRSGPAQAA